MSNSLLSTDAGDMKQAPDTALLVQHLTDTNLNFYGQRAEIAYFYQELLNVLAATAGTGVEVFAFMGSKPCKWTGGSTTPWNSGVSSTSSCTSAEKQVVLENAVRELAGLSLTYPHFVGFTIDDFPTNGGVAELVTTPLPESVSPTQIAAVMAVRDSVNPSFKFWPTTYTVRGQFSEISANSFHLGNGWGEQFNSGSSASLTIEHTSPVTLHNVAKLSFGFADTFADLEDLHTEIDGRGNTRVGRIYKEVLINGTMMFQQDITADDYPRAFVEDISSLWRVGQTNRIEIRITCKDTYGNQNKYFSGKRLNIWGLSLKHNGRELIGNGATVTMSSVSTNSSDPISTFENTTHDYLSVVDGFLLVQPLESGYFSDQAAADLVRVSRTHIGAKDYISVNLSGMGYNWRFRPNIDATKNGKAIATAAAHADGVVVWNLPVNLHYQSSSQGVFAERSPSAALSATEDLLLFHPKYQPTFYDWYQSYTWNNPFTSNLSFSLRDTTTGSGSTTDEALVKYVLLNDDPSEVLYRDTLAGTECSADTAATTCPGFASTSGATCLMSCVSGRELIELSLPNNADEVTVKMVGEAHNSNERWTYIDVPSFVASHWTFDTGVASDMVDIYDQIHAAYDQVRRCAWQENGGIRSIVPPFLPACCSDGFDNDGDGLVDSADADCRP